MFIVELEYGVWKAESRGDPGRTMVRARAKKYSSQRGAKIALSFARRYRPFANAKIIEIS